MEQDVTVRIQLKRLSESATTTPRPNGNVSAAIPTQPLADPYAREVVRNRVARAAAPLGASRSARSAAAESSTGDGASALGARRPDEQIPPIGGRSYRRPILRAALRRDLRLRVGGTGHVRDRTHQSVVGRRPWRDGRPAPQSARHHENQYAQGDRDQHRPQHICDVPRTWHGQQCARIPAFVSAILDTRPFRVSPAQE